MTDSSREYDRADDTDTPPRRRTILGAIGTIAGLTAVSGNAVSQDNDCPKWNPQKGGRTTSLKSGELPGDHHESDNDPWYESAVTFQNCSSCTRLINVRVTEGHIHEESEEEPHESDQTGHLSYHLEGGERKTFWYTGSISNFDMSEPADMNVAISQRSIHHAETPQCYRASDSKERAIGQDNNCPGENPEESGRTNSLMCGEHPADHYEGDDDPWYESLITFHNCSSCTRKVSVGVTEGHIHENEEEPHESDQTRSLSKELTADERKTFQFTGSLDYLDLSEHSDINVAISQRSVEYAQSSRC